jgi:hypothetical protein
LGFFRASSITVIAPGDSVKGLLPVSNPYQRDWAGGRLRSMQVSHIRNFADRGLSVFLDTAVLKQGVKPGIYDRAK